MTQIRHIVVATPRRGAQSYTAHTDSMEVAMRTPDVALYRTAISDLSYDIARNQLTLTALKMRDDMRNASPPVEIEGIVWVDDDVEVPPDTIPRLLAHGADVVAGLYFARRHPFTAQMYRLADGQPGKYYPILDWTPGQVLEVDAVGFGCIYTSMRVMDAIAEAQMQDWRWRLRERIGGRRMGSPKWFEFDWPHGEDFYFCEWARRLGFPLLVDTGLVCKHWGVQPITEETYRSVRPHLYLVGKDGERLEGTGNVAVAGVGEQQQEGAGRWPDVRQLKRYWRMAAGAAGAALLTAVVWWRRK